MSDTNITETAGSTGSTENSVEALNSNTAQEQVSFTTEQVVAILLEAVDSHKAYILSQEQKISALADFVGNQSKRIDILEAKTQDIQTPDDFVKPLEFTTVLDTTTEFKAQ